jgi:DNA invertase Pin-like site-specific DNA recombinase
MNNKNQTIFSNYLKNKYNLFYSYNRVSSKAQDKDENGNLSLKNQNEHIQQYLNNCQIPKTKVFDYYDCGSGYKNSKGNLVNLKRLMRDIKNNYAYNKPSLFIINDISRLSRNFNDGYDILKTFEKYNVEIYSIIDNLWYNNNDYIEQNSIFLKKLIDSQEYSRLLSSRLKRSVEYRKKRGDVLGRTPFGKESYRASGGVRKFRESKDETKIIKKVVSLVDKKGYGYFKKSNLTIRGKNITPTTARTLYNIYNGKFNMSNLSNCLN